MRTSGPDASTQSMNMVMYSVIMIPKSWTCFDDFGHGLQFMLISSGLSHYGPLDLDFKYDRTNYSYIVFTSYQYHDKDLAMNTHSVLVKFSRYVMFTVAAISLAACSSGPTIESD